MELNDLLHAAVDSGASDLLLVSGSPPVLRVDGALQMTDLEPLTSAALEKLIAQSLTEERARQLEEQQDVDYAIGVPRLGRFRFNVHLQRGSQAAAIRHIPHQVPDLDSLGLPEGVRQFANLSSGLVLVTSQTGNGKSTTLAALIDFINEHQAKHIITLEDPIEFLFTHRRSLIEQRAIGVDSPDFATALRHIVRQNPDCILVGELRDLETISTAISAAETGHLVFATLHTQSAAGTVDRLIDVFPAAQQNQIRAQLAECLRGVVSQRLIPRRTGKGRVLAAEVMVGTRSVQRCIREADTHLLPGIVSTGRKFGMQSIEQALERLVLNGEIHPDAVAGQLALADAVAQ